MRCLTVCQPWAHAIIHLGKRIENRTWLTRYRGPLAIHAGKSRKWLEREDPGEWPALYGVDFPQASQLVFGAIIGTVDVVDCLEVRRLTASHTRQWAEGPWCWVLAKPRPLGTPIPWKGQLNLFKVPDEFSHA